MRKHIMFAGAAAAGLLFSAPASAAKFDWDAGIPSLDFSIQGTFTAADDANDDGSFDILFNSGSFLNGTDTGFFTGPTSYLGADNLLYFTSGMPYLTERGTSALTSVGGQFNVRYSDGSYQLADASGARFDFAYFSVTPVGVTPPPPPPNGVPEPHTWALLLLGFGTLGTALRKRRKVRATLAPAT